jgi:hypothetical protein
MSLTIIIVDKIGELKTLNVKNYCEQELYKKCGFKKDTNFMLHATWNVTLNDLNYSVSMYGKTDGKKNFENMCKFTHPISDKTFYGSCALVASCNNCNVNLTIDLWKELNKKITTDTSSSFSFSNISQPQIKKDKQKEKEREKNKEFEKEKEENKKKKEENKVILISEDIKELEEEEYNYSSDEES